MNAPDRERSTEPPRSPCTGVCRLDERTRQCIGCRRTIEEIAAWSHMSESEQRAVLDTLQLRDAGGH